MAYFKSSGPELGHNNRTWLGSDHTIQKTHVLKASAFTGDSVLSGTAVQLDADRLAVPYTDGVLRGFLYSDYPLEHGDYPVSVVVHGDINVAGLPDENFRVPEHSVFTFNAAAAATTTGGAQ